MYERLVSDLTTLKGSEAFAPPAEEVVVPPVGGGVDSGGTAVAVSVARPPPPPLAFEASGGPCPVCGGEPGGGRGKGRERRNVFAGSGVGHHSAEDPLGSATNPLYRAAEGADVWDADKLKANAGGLQPEAARMLAAYAPKVARARR
jgi:hypothetical protein